MIYPSGVEVTAKPASTPASMKKKQACKLGKQNKPIGACSRNHPVQSQRPQTRIRLELLKYLVGPPHLKTLEEEGPKNKISLFVLDTLLEGAYKYTFK